MSGMLPLEVSSKFLFIFYNREQLFSMIYVQESIHILAYLELSVKVFIEDLLELRSKFLLSRKQVEIALNYKV